MARSEARLSVSIWLDDDFLALSPTAQRMFMFLMSQPDLAHDGVIALRERRWSKKAAGLTVAQVGRDLEELAAARFVVVDEDAEELLIRSFIRRDKVYRQPNVLRAAQDHLAVVSSPAILAAIAAELRRIATAEDIGEASASIVAEMLTAIEKATPNPSRNPSEKGHENPSAATPGDRGVVTAVRSDSPSPNSPDSPVPLDAPPARPARETRGKRGTRIPDDFTVTDDMKAWFAANCPGVNGQRETEKFRNYWAAKTGQAATKLDWPATWRNWMLTAAERSGGGPGNALAVRGNAPRPSTTDQRVNAALELAARYAAEEAS